MSVAGPGCTFEHSKTLDSVIGCDISADQLRLARERCPRVLQADAAHLPFGSGSVTLIVATFITDVDDWGGVLREVARVLGPGGRFVYYGLHPCFVGHFADRTQEKDVGKVVLVKGYGDQALKYAGAGEDFLRPKVGSRDIPLAAYLQAFADAGLIMRRFKELGKVVVPGELAIESEKAA
jgi:SAM-dependent methyltransferase